MSKLLLGGYVLTMDEKRTVHHPDAVYIEGMTIVDVGSKTDMLGKYKGQADEILDFPHHIIMPGFMSLHVHSVASNVRGIGPDTFLPGFGRLRALSREFPAKLLVWPRGLLRRR